MKLLRQTFQSDSATIPDKSYRTSQFPDHFSCTCDGWKYMRRPSKRRACRHIQDLILEMLGVESTERSRETLKFHIETNGYQIVILKLSLGGRNG